MTDCATLTYTNITFDESKPLYWTEELPIDDNDIALEEEQFIMSLTPVTSGVKVETGSCYSDVLIINVEDNDGKSCTHLCECVYVLQFVLCDVIFRFNNCDTIKSIPTHIHKFTFAYIVSMAVSIYIYNIYYTCKYLAVTHMYVVAGSGCHHFFLHVSSMYMYMYIKFMTRYEFCTC